MEAGGCSAHHRDGQFSTGDERRGHGGASSAADGGHARRKLVVWASAAALIALVSCVSSFLADGRNGPISTLGEVSTESLHRAPKTLEAQIAKLMQQVRKDSLDEQQSVQRRERVELQLEEHEEWLQQHAKHAISPESLDNVLGGGREHVSMDQLKEELQQASSKAKEDKEQRDALQKVLDAKLNQLSSEQIAAHDAQLKAQQRAALRSRGASHTSALASAPLRKNKPDTAAEELLATVGEEMLRIPAVANALTQALGSSDLDLAREIAKSLGKNETDMEPIDPAIVAEAEIAAAEKEQGVPLSKDKTPAVNVSGLVEPLPDDLVAEMEQAKKEIQIQKDLET